MKDFKIATCQMNVVDNKDTNIEHAIQLIKKASSNGAKLITLPEMFNTPYDNSKFIEYCEEETTSKTLNSMQDIAREENIYLQSGSIPEKERDRKASSGLLRMQPKEDLSIMMRSACMQALPGSCVFFWDFTM